MSPEDVARETHDRSNVIADDTASTVNASTSNAVESTGSDGLAFSSGRDKGKDAARSLRQRQRISGHSQSNNSDGAMPGGSSESDRDIKAAHRAAEHEARMVSPVANDAEATQTTVVVGGGILLPGRVANGGTNSPPPSTDNSINPPHNERRESAQQPALPKVDEAGENSSTGGRSRSSRLSNHTVDSDDRPPTPAKDNVLKVAGHAPVGQIVRTQPSNDSNGLKPDSVDSGYGVSRSRSRSGTVGSGEQAKAQISRKSLDKELPPLPKADGGLA